MKNNPTANQFYPYEIPEDLNWYISKKWEILGIWSTKQVDKYIPRGVLYSNPKSLGVLFAKKYNGDIYKWTMLKAQETLFRSNFTSGKMDKLELNISQY